MHRLHSLTSLLSSPTPAHLAVLALLAVVLASGVYLLARLSPPTILASGVCAEAFSGHWNNMHIPIPIDRTLLIFGVVSLLLGGWRLVSDRRLILRPIHLLILIVATWATASAIAAGTIGAHGGFYALLDRLGYIPFLGFVLAPVLFGDHQRRNILLIALTILGGYLAIISLMEGVGLGHYVIPSYINNPNVGINFGRARGPFVDGDGNGLGLVFCGVAAAVGLSVWKDRRGRIAAALVVVGCGLGVLFTLTRAIWLGAAAGAVVALLAARPTRRWVLPGLVVGAIVFAAVIVAVPGMKAKVVSRSDSTQPIWDRDNTNRAAVLAMEEHPVFGIGWQTFITNGNNYLREAGTYPLTGENLEVHNVFLSHAAEIGIPGALLWTAALLGAVGGAIVRRGPPDLYPWRIGLLAIGVCFVVVANLGPLSYAFPNLVLWMWAGVAGAPYLSRPALDPVRNLTVQEDDENQLATV